jgi:hypothetical protein
MQHEVNAEQSRVFSAPVVAGLYTGWVLTDEGFSPIHECAEWVMGHPIWTHEFADQAFLEKVRATIRRACPEIEEAVELVAGCNKHNVDAKAMAIFSLWPQGFTLAKGGCERVETPLESLKRIAPDVEVITVELSR